MRVFEERGITHLDLHGTKHQDVSSEAVSYTHLTLPTNREV